MTHISPKGVDLSRFQTNLKRGFAASASVLALSLMAQPVAAQDAESDEDTIVVTGSRQVIQDAIALKRNNTQIVDGLSADEIGDIPALSIGEALENITGVASHRENGGATEVSIRGLGPYLSSTVVNGRAATNGSGDRSVNFSQFPSELVNKLAVFKTQDASQIEGGVAGQIQIETIKPLDFGKRRLQFEAKGNVNPDQLKQDDTEAGDFGYRLTGSYTDQFELGNGDIGFSIGVQTSDISQPEAEARQTSSTSSSRPACLITNGLSTYVEPQTNGTVTGFSNNPETRRRGDDDCDDVNVEGFDLSDTSGSASPTAAELADFRNGTGSRTEGFDTSLTAAGTRVDLDTPFVFAPSQRHFRQNDTRDQRDAIFGAVQWAPNDRVDINLDAQWSERIQSEQRSDLTFNGGRRNDTSLNAAGFNTTLDSLQTTSSGAILFAATDGNIEVQGGDYERKETYLGFGGNVEYEVTDRLTVAADYGFSETERVENNREFRIQSDRSPEIVFDRTNGPVPQYGLWGSDAFDVNDPLNYVDRLRVRVDNDVDRTNTINSARFDTTYELGGSFFKELKAGVRWADQDYVDLGGAGGVDSGDPLNGSRGRFSFEIENDGELTVNNREVIDDSDDDLYDTAEFANFQSNLVNIIGSTRDACYNPFVEEGFLSSVRSGDLVTIFNDDGSVASSTNSWAQFDAGCVAETAVNSLNSILGDINSFLTNPDADENSFAFALNNFSSTGPELADESLDVIDVEEVTKSVYLMTNYEGSIDGSLPISGNIGVRIVDTDVTATGYRSALNVNTADDGELTLSFGDLEAVSAEHSYTRVLPSANMIMEISPEKIVRLGVFRAMSRADPADMGFSRTISSNSGDDENPITTIEGLIGSVNATGNPEIDPLMSWNYDASFEYYPNPDTILAVGAYYKQFQGGFENIRQNETYTINGTDVERAVSVSQTSDDESNLFGVELTASHGFTYLPGLLSGLGAKISYNYVTSNFEFEDSRYGDAFQRQLDGTVIQTNEGIIAPAGLPGLSENTIAAQVYYGIGGLDLAVNYKYRDNYFQPFTSDGTRLRYVGEVGVWEARASYTVNENFRLSAEIINIGSEPKEQAAYVIDDIYEVNDYGPRIFFGVRGRF
ncbi:MAG: TonB-dependent receptor plug domain-containing protein [Litorimonas sp.]